jgi:glycerol-3-phosphate dehydrogenase
MADLGRRPGADLTEAEIRWLVRQEWAMCAADIVWRRSKLGLRMNAAEIAALEDLVQEILAETVPAESPA